MVLAFLSFFALSGGLTAKFIPPSEPPQCTSQHRAFEDLNQKKNSKYWEWIRRRGLAKALALHVVPKNPLKNEKNSTHFFVPRPTLLVDLYLEN